ncbi:MAG TPA: glutathione S-transferase family protein [Polyangiaceae bacterium]|nr:glutathione S-transferase family protein [Polyangiaceae bacterium]
MAIVYYHSPMSSAVRTTWAIEELGLPCERRLMDLAAKGTREAWFLEKNPNGKVPVLEVDGVPLFESTAILVYLGETYGVDAGLFPPPGIARGQVLQWMLWAQVTLAEAVQRFGRNISPLIPEEQRNAKAAEAARQDVDAALGILDGALAGREYLVGTRFSFADLATAGFFGWLQFMGLSYSSHPNVSAWAARCQARPAHARARG